MKPISTTLTGIAILLSSIIASAQEESRFDAISRSMSGAYNSPHTTDHIAFIAFGVLVLIVLIISLIQRQIHMHRLKKQHEELVKHQKELINHHKDFLDHVRRK